MGSEMCIRDRYEFSNMVAVDFAANPQPVLRAACSWFSLLPHLIERVCVAQSAVNVY